jgi:hypothetical protein
LTIACISLIYKAKEHCHQTRPRRIYVALQKGSPGTRANTINQVPYYDAWM